MEQKKPPTLLFPVRKKLVKKKFHKKIDRQTGVRHTFFSTVTRNLIFFFFFLPGRKNRDWNGADSNYRIHLISDQAYNRLPA